jgi:membrane protein DedA with SNARE-associated domain
MESFLQETVALISNWHVWLAIGAISLLGACGGLITYNIGKKGMPAIESKFSKLEPEKLERFAGWYGRWGNLVLLVTMIPVMGTMIRLVAGMREVRLLVFLVWCLVALLIRNWVLFIVAHGIIQSL